MAKPLFSQSNSTILQLGHVTAALLAGLVSTPPLTAIVFDDKYSVHECIINIDDKYFQNGSDHEVVASYSGLYEEGEVEHINCVWPVFPLEQLDLKLN